jgi:hypothetical protein
MLHRTGNISTLIFFNDRSLSLGMIVAERESSQARILNVRTRAKYTKYQLNKTHHPILFFVGISDKKVFFIHKTFPKQAAKLSGHSDGSPKCLATFPGVRTACQTVRHSVRYVEAKRLKTFLPDDSRDDNGGINREIEEIIKPQQIGDKIWSAENILYVRTNKSGSIEDIRDGQYAVRTAYHQRKV